MEIHRFVKISTAANHTSGEKGERYANMEEKMEAKLDSEFQHQIGDLLSLLSQLEGSSAKLQSLMLRLNYNDHFLGGGRDDADK